MLALKALNFGASNPKSIFFVFEEEEDGGGGGEKGKKRKKTNIHLHKSKRDKGMDK